MQIVESLLSQLETAIFAKDLSHRYIYCNEKLARASGEDSAAACYGKTDADLIWKKYSDVYLLSDKKVFAGHSLCNIFEPQRQTDCDQMTILINKHPLLNRAGEIVGVVGSYVDVTNLSIARQHNIISSSAIKGFDLGKYFDHATLTNREFQVLKMVLLGRTAKQIASTLLISQKTVETHITKIKEKMQCTSRGDIISQAVISGLYQRLLSVLTL